MSNVVLEKSCCHGGKMFLATRLAWVPSDLSFQPKGTTSDIWRIWGKKQNKNKSLVLWHFNDFSVDRQRQLGQNRRLRRQRQFGRHPAGLRLEEIFSSEAKCWSVNVSRSRQMHSISWQLGKRDFFLLWYNFVGAGDRPLHPSNTLSCTTISWFNLFNTPMDVLRHIHLPSYSKHN